MSKEISEELRLAREVLFEITTQFTDLSNEDGSKIIVTKKLEAKYDAWLRFYKKEEYTLKK